MSIKPGTGYHGEETLVADNFIEMVDAILERTRQTPVEVLCDDDPYRREIGFCISDLRYRVRLTSIIRREGDPERFEKYVSYLPHTKGREALAALLSKGLEPTEPFVKPPTIQILDESHHAT